MRKIKVLLSRYNTEVEVVTSIDVKVGDFVVVHAPEGYESNGKYMTAEVIDVSTDVGLLEERFVQKIETSYYEQLQQAKADKLKMKAVLDKIWNDKTDDQKLDILSSTEPLIEETPPVEEPVAEDPIIDETTTTESVGTV